MLRKTLTIFSLVGLVVSVGLWFGSYFFSVVIFLKSPGCWELGKGCVGFGRDYYISSPIGMYGPIGPRPASIYGGGFRYTFPRLWKSRAFDSWETEWSPRFSSSPLAIVIPLWIPSVLFGAATSSSCRTIYRRRKRRKLGLCLKCGYDLRGLADRCPECGETK